MSTYVFSSNKLTLVYLTADRSTWTLLATEPFNWYYTLLQPLTLPFLNAQKWWKVRCPMQLRARRGCPILCHNISTQML